MGTLLSKKRISTEITVDTRLEESKKTSPKIFPTTTHVITLNHPEDIKLERPENSKILTQFILNYSLYNDDETPVQSKKN